MKTLFGLIFLQIFSSVVLDYKHGPVVSRDLTNPAYALTEARLKEIRKHQMYPFKNKDYVNQTRVKKDLSFQLPFYGFRYNRTEISIDGYLGFSDFENSSSSEEYPLVFPVKDYPQKKDPAFIGIFYSKCRIGKLRQNETDTKKPGVYFRVEENLKDRMDKFGVEIRERLKWDIRENVIGAGEFEPNHAVIATWKDVSFVGGTTEALYKTNTFQMVLATDQFRTYAIFNYVKLDWTGPDSGKNGTPAFVGFNAGKGTGSFQYLPYSQNATIEDLVKKGRHYFQIDENVVPGTCNKKSKRHDLYISPGRGNMLGGTVVNITGPCFRPHEPIVCMFDDEAVDAIFINEDRILCVQPRLNSEGLVDFRVGTWRGIYKTKYYSLNPRESSNIHVKIFSNASEIHLTWNKDSTFKSVNISLWGHDGHQLSYICDVDTVPNNGSYKLELSKLQNCDFSEPLIQIFQINGTVSLGEFPIAPKIWSQPLLLHRYFPSLWEEKLGKNWAEKMCDAWIDGDRKLENFTEGLPNCPCTLEQALSNKGQFRPDFGCSGANCSKIRKAVQCVRSGIPSIQGEQECCYDTNNFLMLSQDQKNGSYPRRSQLDILPEFLCCKTQEEDSENCRTFRYERRPTNDCKNYQTPGIAGVYGSLHFLTFDSLRYTFSGKGEFVLMRSVKDRLDIQGRFEKIDKNMYGDGRATKLTSVVGRGRSGTVVEVSTRPEGANWKYRLNVLINGSKIYFDEPEMKLQHFPGVTVYTPPNVHNQSEVVVMFDSGAGVEVIEDSGYLSARIYLPRTYLNQTTGLLGNWSLDMSDDLTLPNGKTVERSDQNEILYKKFGMKWMLDDEDPRKGPSLFTRSFERSASTFNDKTFQPEFSMDPYSLIQPNRSYYTWKGMELCSPKPDDLDLTCFYDYAMTYDKNVARLSLNSQKSILALIETNLKKCISCGVLETPRFGKKSTFGFTPGTVVEFECQQGYVLIGDKKRRCLPDGKWNLPENATKCVNENRNGTVI